MPKRKHVPRKQDPSRSMWHKCFLRNGDVTPSDATGPSTPPGGSAGQDASVALDTPSQLVEVDTDELEGLDAAVMVDLNHVDLSQKARGTLSENTSCVHLYT